MSFESIEDFDSFLWEEDTIAIFTNSDGTVDYIKDSELMDLDHNCLETMNRNDCLSVIRDNMVDKYFSFNNIHKYSFEVDTSDPELLRSIQNDSHFLKYMSSTFGKVIFTYGALLAIRPGEEFKWDEDDEEAESYTIENPEKIKDIKIGATETVGTYYDVYCDLCRVYLVYKSAQKYEFNFKI